MLATDLYQEYAIAIRKYLMRFVNESDAEDLTQEIFIKVDKHIKDFRGDSSPKTWLYRIATNALRDFMKSKAHRFAQAQMDISEQELEEYVSTPKMDDSLERNVFHNEMNDCIREFIHRLPENYSTVLVLKELEGYKIVEISEILGVSPETVKVRLHRSRARLKKELNSGCTISVNHENRLECERRNRSNSVDSEAPTESDS